MTIKVDLLPTKEKKFGIDPVMIFLVLVIIICTFGFFVFGKSLENSIAAEEKAVAQLDDTIKELKAKLPDIDKRKADNAKLQQQIDTVQGLKNDPVRYANLLWEIGDVLPGNCWVQSITIDPATKSVVLAGTSAQVGNLRPLESIAALMKNLMNSRYFVDATLASTSQGTAGGLNTYSFQIETHYDDMAALKSPEQVQPKGTITTPSPAPGTIPPIPIGTGSASPAASGEPGASPAASGAPGASPAASGAPEGSPAVSGSPEAASPGVITSASPKGR